MDRRHEQLIAAAEALRGWVYAQRATWAEDYATAFAEPRPRAVPQRAPALVLTPVIADAIAPSLVSEKESADAVVLSAHQRADAVLRWLSACAARLVLFGSQGAGHVRQLWLGSTVIVLVLGGGWAVRAYWSDMKPALTANLAASRDAVASRSQALTERATAQIAKATAPPPAEPAVKPKRRLEVESTPIGARVIIDGSDRGVTPLTVENLAVGSHLVVISAPEGSIERTISMASSGTVQLNEAIFSGWLHVSSPIELQISEGRRSLSLDDSNQVLLAAGLHNVRFENRALGVYDMRRIEVRPGETTSFSYEPPPAHLSVTASEGATVAVDGDILGQTPLVDYPVKIGTRDLTITSASGEVRHQTITATVRPVHVNVDFSKR